MWKKYTTFNTSYPLRKICFMIKEYTRDISNICVSTFVISERFWRLIYTWKIYPTLYVNFHSFLFNNIMIIIDDIYDIITTYGSLFMLINIR